MDPNVQDLQEIEMADSTLETVQPYNDGYALEGSETIDDSGDVYVSPEELAARRRKKRNAFLGATIPLCVLALVVVVMMILFFAPDDLGVFYTLDGNGFVVSKVGKDTVGDFEIPSTHTGIPVVAIAPHAFEDCTKITFVSIPDGTQTIGSHAFAHCDGMKSIAIPCGVTSIADSAFEDCSSLISISIPDSVETIDRFAFKGCVGLVSIAANAKNAAIVAKQCGAPSFSVTITSGDCIEDDAFANCHGLIDISLPNSIRSIGANAFWGCDLLPTVGLPDGLISIGQCAFKQCTSLASITIPSSVESIEFAAFSQCKGLASFSISNGLKRIKEYAFDGCSALTSIEIPDSVNQIGMYAFAGCLSLERMVLPFVGTTRADYAYQWDNSTFGYLFDNEMTNQHDKLTQVHQIQFTNGEDGFIGRTYYIPSSLRIVEVTGGYVPPGAFDGCKMLTEISIPKTTTKIEKYSFNNCIGLTSFSMPDSAISIGEHAFEGCIGLSSIVFPAGLQKIDTYAFADCNGISSVVFPAGLREIAECSFENCAHLSSIAIPNSVVTLASNAFIGCVGLQSVTGNSINVGLAARYSQAEAFSVIITDGSSIENNAFEGCSGLVSIEIPDSVTKIGNEAFSRCIGLKSIALPNRIDSFGFSAFYNCTSLTSITAEGRIAADIAKQCGSTAYSVCITKMDNVRANQFEKCIGMEYLYLPEGVEHIESYAFTGCGLKAIELPSTVMTIGYCAFKGCNRLQSIVLNDGLQTIGEEAFGECSELQSIHIPSSVMDIGDSLFSACINMSAITVDENNEYYHSRDNCLICTDSKCLVAGCKTSVLPSDGSVTSLGFGAFRDCSTLKSLVLPQSVTGIAYNALRGCSGLISIVVEAGNTAFYSAGNCLIHTENGSLVQGCSNSIIPTDGSILSISDCAFYRCEGLVSLDIPDSVKRIEFYAFAECESLAFISIGSGISYIDSHVFYGCSAIETIQVKAGNATFSSVNNCLINNEQKTLVLGCKNSIIPADGRVEAIGGCSFAACVGLTTIEIPDSVKQIGYHAFDGAGLTTVVIPDSVTVLQEGVFCNCKELESATIGNGIIEVERFTFAKCTKMTSVRIGANVTEIAGYAFDDCSIETVYCSGDIGSWARMQKDFCLSSSLKTLYIQGTQLKDTLIITNDIAEVLDDAFAYVRDITDIVIQSSVFLGQYAFGYCPDLHAVAFESGRTVIEKWVFANSTNLSTVTIPATVKRIEEGTFFNCKIRSIYYEGTKKQWSQIVKEEVWNANNYEYTVYCQDGEIVVSR